MNNKNFFITNFLNFLLSEKNFFEKQRNRFAIFFCESVKKHYPQIDIESQKEEITFFYDNLFLTPYLKDGNFSPIIDFLDYLEEAHIDFDIINKTFLLLANQYIKYIFPNANIGKLKNLTQLLEFYIDTLKTRNELLETDNSLPKEILKIFDSQETIYVFGVYKGVPISNPSKILNVNRKTKSIKVYANNYQIVASKFQKEVYLLESKKNLTLKAFVEDIDPIKKILTLTNLEKVKRGVTKRNYIRVQPKEEIKASIIYNDQIFEGKIYDLSIKGISIISDKMPIEINNYLKIEFHLFAKAQYKFSFVAQLRSISSYNNKIRYHVYFEPNSKEEILLEKYIKKREKEIIKELMFYLKSVFV